MPRPWTFLNLPGRFNRVTVITNLHASCRGRPERLFCYGTLCLPEIMHAVCRTQPDGMPATLAGYACYALTGRHYPAIIPAKGGKEGGVLYTGLRRGQLARLDSYEGEEYRRRRVWVNVGIERVQAWTYVLRPRYYYRLSRRRWSLEQFRCERLQFYRANRHWGSHGRDTNQST